MNLHEPYGIYEKYIKRPLDFSCSLMAVTGLSWLYVILAIAVKANLGSPVIFKQERAGLNEKTFRLYKFRSMTDAKDKNGKLLSDEERLTKFGEFLRSTSLDELPELFNILKGEMSIIGPRPLLTYDVPYMNEQQHRRHEVRPGLTGLAQCNGRNSLTWDEKLALDVEYIDKISFKTDLEILIKTVIKVLKRDDIAFDEGMNIDLKDWNELKANGEVNNIYGDTSI